MIRKILFGMSLLLMTGTQGVSSDENSILKKDKLSKRVNDEANVLSPDEENLLEKKLSVYEDSTSTQIVIVTVASLDDDISKVAVELGEKWGIGQKGKNNGLIVLISIEQRKMFIATGYGLEGSLPDAMCKRIIENDIKPHFKNKDYFNGVDNGINKLISAMSGEYTSDSGNSSENTHVEFLFLVFVVISFVVCIFTGLVLKDLYLIAFIVGGIVAGLLGYLLGDIVDLYLLLTFAIGGILSFVVSSLDFSGSGGTYYSSGNSGSINFGGSFGSGSMFSGGGSSGFIGGGGSFGGGGAGGSW